MTTLDPQLPQKPHLPHETASLQLGDEQKRHSRAESEPDTPVPSSLNHAFSAPADKVTQQPSLSKSINPVVPTQHSKQACDSHLPASGNGLSSGSDLRSESTEAAATPFSSSTSSSPYAASLNELSAASLQYLPTFSGSPDKLNHLQNLMSSLQKIMNDQSFVMGDLRTQLDEIQDVLNRVSPKQHNMTTEERQILQNAQRMKNLAEEVIASNITSSERRVGLDKQESAEQNTRISPLTLSLPSLATNAMEPKETPPSTAAASSPGAPFQLGDLRHRSSSASFSSSANSDRQYTQDGDDRSSRPSSVASSYRRHQRKKSLRKLEPLNNGNNRDSRYDHESNAAFDRICSLLGELITDASTAVTTAPDGSQLSNIPVPQFEPLVESDSEPASSSVEDSGTDEEDSNSIGEDIEDTKTTTTINNTTPTTTSNPTEVDDPFLRRLQVREGGSKMDGIEVEVELEPADRCRTGFRPRLDKTSKRLSSLFMELQNTQTIQDATPKEVPGRRRQLSEVNPFDRELLSKEKTTRRPRHSISSMSLSSARLSRPHSICLPVTTAILGGKSAENGDALQDSGESSSESLLVGRTRKARQRGSISSLRSEPVHRHTYNNEPQQQKVVVDAELHRTVETIDGLTRDLVAVATHQNWMQMKLQKTLQFQKEQIQQIERVHSNADTTSLAAEEEGVVANQQQLDSSASATVDDQPRLDSLSSQKHPLADLSRSLKQVAVSVGKVLASSAKHGTSRNSVSSSSAPSNRTSRSSAGRFAGKDFSRYFQELEKIAALGGKIGFGKGSDVEDIVSENPLEETSSSLGKKGGFGKKRANNSYRNSAATLVDDDGFSSSLEESKLAAFSHSGDYSDFESAREEVQADHSRRGSSSMSDAPPELEDFAAQCKLLTKALVLPFVQLTHHAMTSQDSALALAPRSSRFSDSARDLNSTLEIMEDLENMNMYSPPFVSASTSNTRRSSLSTGPAYNSLHTRRESSSSSIHQLSSPLPNWSSSVSAAGRDLDSILKGHGELSPDTIVKAKAFMSTGLYLLHLMYWTTLFVIGTIILDPWLAETAGQQVVRIVDQVKDVTPNDGRPRLEGSSPLSLEHPNQSNIGQGGSVNKQKLKLSAPVFEVNEEEDAAATKALEQGRLQALEDRAIEVAVGFESLKQRLGSNSNRPWVKGLWDNLGNLESTASALAAATLSAPTTVPSPAKPLVPQTNLTATTTDVTAQRPSQQHAWAGAGLGPVPRIDLMVRRKSL